MRGFILTLAAIAIAVWSLFCWAVYSLIGFAGGLASANIGLLPFPPEIVLWTVDLLGGMGGVAVWIVWGLGAAAIALVTLIPLALAPGRNAQARRAGTSPDYFDPGRVERNAAAADSRSADDIVARVLGRGPRR